MFLCFKGRGKNYTDSRLNFSLNSKSISYSFPSAECKLNVLPTIFLRLLSNLTAPPCGPLEPNGPSSPLRPCKEKIHYLIKKKFKIKSSLEIKNP